jgi:N-acetylmuramoyl-L-alanine amidase
MRWTEAVLRLAIKIMSQGTTSVVPNVPENQGGLQPLRYVARRNPSHLCPSSRFAVAILIIFATLLGPADSSASSQSPPAPQPPPSRYSVVLDAAHGGQDTGATLDGGRLEKNFTLAFSVRLRSLLTARGIEVTTTREQDATVDADRRAEIANHAGAQACLSLHASHSGLGVHLYVSSLAPVPPARFAPWKTAQAAWVTRSLALAGVLNSTLQHNNIPVILGRTALPGIDSMTCPTVAVEIAPENAAGKDATGTLDDPDYQAHVAEALAAALLEWRTEARQP